MIKKKAVIIWAKFGPYHHARFDELRKSKFFSVAGIEVNSGSKVYSSLFQVENTPVDNLFVTLGFDDNSPKIKRREALCASLSDFQPDVVFIPGWSNMDALFAMEWCLSNDIPVVLMSDTTRDAERRHWAREAIKRRVVGLADSALVAGQPQAKYISELSMEKSKVFLGYDVVDNSFFSQKAQDARNNWKQNHLEIGLPENYLLCCARLIPEKNLLRLIAAFEKYSSRSIHEPWHLLIVGPGPMEKEIRAYIEHKCLSHAVSLIGAQSYEKMPIFYGLSKALILPSVSETWGLVVNEAMASKLPVLVSSHCGCVEDLLQDGRNGFSFDPLDIEGITIAIEKITAPDCDRTSMGKFSQKCIAEWNLDRFLAGFEEAAKTAIDTPIKKKSLVNRAILKALTRK